MLPPIAETSKHSKSGKRFRLLSALAEGAHGQSQSARRRSGENAGQQPYAEARGIEPGAVEQISSRVDDDGLQRSLHGQINQFSGDR